MQLFVSTKGFVKVYDMKPMNEFPQAQLLFVKEVGAPKALFVDPHRAHISKEMRSFSHKIGTALRVLEESTQNANRAELYIRLLKDSIHKYLGDRNAPIKLWCYATELQIQIFNLTAKHLFQLQGHNPHLATFDDMGDISNLCNFGWYEWCYFLQGNTAFPMTTQGLVLCLGPCKNEGNNMCQWVLQRNGQIVQRQSLRRLTSHELSVTVQNS